MVDSAHVSEVGHVVGKAGANTASRGRRVEGVRRHARLLQETCVCVLEIEIGNQVAAAGERGGVPMIHAEQSSFVAALAHAAHQFEQIHFRAAKRIVVLVAIKYSHIQAPVGRCAPGTDWQTGGDYAGGHS